MTTDQSVADTPVRKNLVLVHLESISNTILWQYRAELATVWRLAGQARYFTHFYTASTSTEMSTMDVLQGMPLYYDHFPRFCHPDPAKLPYFAGMASLFSYLVVDGGYRDIHVACSYFGRISNVQETERGPRIGDYRPEVLVARVKTELVQCKDKGQPFVLFLNNNVSHMALDDDVTLAAESFTDRFKRSYQRLDSYINQMLAILAELGLWENTVVALYGDHGDELWSHALNKGFCHCIAPYSSLVWTPFIVYDNGRNAGPDDRLMSAVDVRETLLKMLFPGYVPKAEALAGRSFDAVPLSGQDVMARPRDLAFSQNLFSLQLEYADLEAALTKSYSVTDGTYRLVASTGGKRPKDGGLEFYCERLDPTNSRNLLDFFVVGVDGDILSFRPPAEITPDSDFTRAFTPTAVQHMQEVYARLKHELIAYVREKEALALKHKAAEFHIMPEHAFRQARKRIRRDWEE